MRHQAEITADCRISLENISNRPFSFSVLPSKADRLYILDAGSQEERVAAFSLYYCVEYVDPVYPGVQIPGAANNSRPTLRGIGSVYDHFSLGRCLEKAGTALFVLRSAMCVSRYSVTSRQT